MQDDLIRVPASEDDADKPTGVSDGDTTTSTEKADTLAADEKTKDKEKASFSNFHIVLAQLKKYPAQLVGAIIALIISSTATLAIPAGFKAVIDHGFSGGTANIDFYFQLLLGIVVVLGFATATRFYFVSWLGERVVADIRAMVQENLLAMEPAFFEENRPSEISSRLTADTSIIELVVGTTVSVALRNGLIAIFGVIYLFWLAPHLTGMLLLAIPLIIAPIALLGRRFSKVSRESQDRIADVGSAASEALGAMKIVQAFGQEQREAENFRGVTERTFATAKRRITLRAILTCVAFILMLGGIVLLMWQGATDVAEGRMTGGTIAAFIGAGILVAGSFGSLTDVYSDLLRGAAAASRLNELLAARPDITAPANPIALPEPARGQIVFDRVMFRYPTRPENLALDGFSLRIDPGETVAVVGPSGAGKSTLFQLIERFYDPESGTVRIDGVALPSADPAEIRKRIAYVPQETVLFAANARDNLRYGRWDATDEEIAEAVRLAHAEEFLTDLPDGLDTWLGEGGTRLSGGQRQRIAIARAILRDAPILLLDEATSALDTQSERAIQDALDRLMQGRTTLVIAHRLSTVRNADRIIVMDKGRIVESGDHDSLAQAGGLYDKLSKLQFQT